MVLNVRLKIILSLLIRRIFGRLIAMQIQFNFDSEARDQSY